jgi:hypothetical protein
MLSAPDRDPHTWLTIPDILSDLRVTPADWQDWEATGQTPAGVIWPDGQTRVSVLSYTRWLDDLPAGNDGIPTADEIRDVVLYALEVSGERGLTHTELCRLFTHHHVDVPAETVGAALTALTHEGACHPHTTTHAGHPVVRYRTGEPR